MKNLILAVLVVFSFSSCGSSVKKVVDQSKQTQKKLLISEDNFVNLAKHHYQRELTKLQKTSVDENNNNKFRSYPGARNANNTITDAIKVESITPFNKYVQSMKLSYKTKRIDVKIKKNLYADISLYVDNTLVKNKQLTINDFTKLNMQGVQ